MPAARASSDVFGFSMPVYSQFANVNATPLIRRTGNYSPSALSHNANMDDEIDKNGGPNHLRAWMAYRNIKGVDLANAIGGNVSPGMISDLVNSKRQLSAKWLRRLAPHLKTTPGLLLDHDPHDLDSDIIEIWCRAEGEQRHQLVDLAKVVVKASGRG